MSTPLEKSQAIEHSLKVLYELKRKLEVKEKDGSITEIEKTELLRVNSCIKLGRHTSYGRFGQA